MSFSSDVKKELANIQASDCCLKAELYGIIRYKAMIKLTSAGIGIEISTMHNVVARRIIFLFKKIYQLDLDIVGYQRQNLDFKVKYVLNLPTNALEILKDLKLINYDNTINDQINYEILKKDCCKGALLRGLFLVQGSINDPYVSNYHLEIIISNGNDFPYLEKILGSVGIYVRSIQRKKGFVIYLKKSDQIGDFLKFVGASNCLFYFEDQRIKKDYSNSVNRVMNCEISNEQKAILAAKEQIENINFLTKEHGLVNLTQRLVDAIVLRTKFPDDSLSFLSENSLDVIGKNISKSGLSHCFKDIKNLCEEIKGKKK